MIEFFQYISTFLIILGLGYDAIGAYLLMRSLKFSGFLTDQKSQALGEEVKKEHLGFKQKKTHFREGLFLLLLGFIVQIIGYLLTLIF